MRNILFLVLFTAALLLAFYFYRESQTTKTKLEEAKMQVSEAENQLLKHQRTDDSLKVLPAANSNSVNTNTEARNAALQKLTKAGFNNPEKQLLESLQARPELLPRTGTLGGQMAYRDITVITEQFALGYFEDGHMGGYSMLRYKATSPADIRWKLIDNHDL